MGRTVDNSDVIVLRAERGPTIYSIHACSQLETDSKGSCDAENMGGASAAASRISYPLALVPNTQPRQSTSWSIVSVREWR